MCERRAIARRHACQRARVLGREQHHDAMLDVAAPAIEHGEAFDRALAGRLGHEIGHGALVAVGDRLHAGVLRQRVARCLP